MANMSMAAGLYISESQTDDTPSYRKRAALLSIITSTFKLTTSLARDFVVGLPDEIGIELEEIIDISAMQAENNKNFHQLTTEEAISLFKQAEVLISQAGFKVNLVLPTAAAAATDDITIGLAKMITNAKHDHRHRVALLTGGTGVGKTARIRAACVAAGVDPDLVAYYSMPTLQPEDMAGIPAPDPDNVAYFRYRMLKGLDKYEVFIFDEFNRAHDKVHNAVMQLILEKRINDMVFPNIKAIFLAVNPSDDPKYLGTYDLDLAVKDRIDHFYEIPKIYNATVMARNLSALGTDPNHAAEVAEIAISWQETLPAASQEHLNPRRLEKMLMAHLAGESIYTTIDKKTTLLPLEGLLDMLGKKDVLTIDRLLSDPDAIERQMTAKGKQAFDVRDRFVELMDRLYHQRRGRDYVTVAHLFQYIPADKLPSPQRNRAMWRWVQRHINKYATPEQAASYISMLESRAAGKTKIKEDLKRIGAELFKEQEAKDAKISI
jgi:hypothetical protein